MQPNFGDTPQGDQSTIGQFGSTLKQQVKIDVEDFINAVGRLNQVATQINKTFGQGRQRVVELQQAVADAIPGINRMGGQLADVQTTISQIALASRRNVVATTQQTEKLFGAMKLLEGTGQDVESIANAFLDVGIGIDEVANNLEGAMKYVQSIGANTTQVLGMVTRNMDQMNRYQFEGGVKGLTKMAAQASMLRFDMQNTFNLAEKVLSPEGAIEVASAFQRLGVAAGNLVDPFQLMNLSINDPSGLQNSLADVSKQFTYFDEKTKTFKINPQGVMILREMEQAAGLAQGSLSKMGLAAAELDKRISAVNAAGLKITDEEDKQFLANIARVGKGGEYEVQIKDARGEYQTRKLTEITQDEFDKLIKEQKEGPKTLEEMTRSQMSISQLIQADVSAIRNALLGGVASTGQIGGGIESIRNVTDKFTGTLSEMASAKGIREEVTDVIEGAKALAKDLFDPNKNMGEVLKDFAGKFKDKIDSYGTKFSTMFDDYIKNVAGKLGSSSDDLAKKTKEYLENYSKKRASESKGAGAETKTTGTTTKTTTGTTTKTTTKAGEEIDVDTFLSPAARRLKAANAAAGMKAATNNTATIEEIRKIAEANNATITSKVEMGGKIVIDVNFNNAQGLTPQQLQDLEKVFADKLRELPVQNFVVNMTTAPNALGKPQ